MLYTVELNFSDAGRADEWNAWYETYLKKLITLPGLTTAQRFRAVEKTAQKWEYLALYSVASLDVYATDAYRAIGGGGQASLHFKGLITRRRNVYEGVARMPEVTGEGRVLLCEDAPHGLDLPDVMFVPLRAASGRQKAGLTELDGEPAQRALAVTDAGTVARLGLVRRAGLAVYAPVTGRFAAAG